MKKIELTPIGIVHSTRKEIEDDFWDKEKCYIALNKDYPPNSFDGLESFSHVTVVFHFHKVKVAETDKKARHPRKRKDFPKVSVFSQIGKRRPNLLGVTICKIEKIDGNKLHLKGLDAINGTPVIDIKPWAKELAPRGKLKQPEWMSEMMKEYWE